MSRSKRKTPVSGNTTSESDKRFKVAEHKRERRQAKLALKAGRAIKHPKAFGNPWASDKDGKFRFDPKKLPRLMRK